MSPSAVGKAIGRLEDHLDVRLFHRSTRTVSLTAEGSSFLEHCRRILGELDAAEREVAMANTAPKGILRLSLPLAGMLMAPALSAFMQAYPDVELDLDFTDRLVDVIDEGLDVVIRAGEIGDSRLMMRKLGQFRLKLVCAPAYIAQAGRPHHPSDLRGHASLFHRYATSGKLEPWPLEISDKDITLPRRAVVNTIEPLIDMAERGLGIACLPDFAIRDQLECGRLVTVLDDHTHHTGTFRLLWPSSKYLSPKLRVFVDFMQQNLGFLPGSDHSS